MHVITYPQKKEKKVTYPSSEEYVKGVTDKGAAQSLNVELQGSWTVSVGDQDQCVHLWKYAGGYHAIDSANKIMTADAVSHIYTCYFIITFILYLSAHIHLSLHLHLSLCHYIDLANKFMTVNAVNRPYPHFIISATILLASHPTLQNI